MPIPDTIKAIAAKTPSSVAFNRGCAALDDTHSAIGRTLAIGTSGSISRTLRRIALTTGAGSPSTRATMSISAQVR